MRTYIRKILKHYGFEFKNVPNLSTDGYFSQYGQDKIVNELVFKNMKNGVFVDVGAYDGIKYSNTYFFEKELGWTGLAIEPMEDAFLALTSNRQCNSENLAISTKEGEEEYLVVTGFCRMLSGLTRAYDVQHRKRISRDLKKYGGETFLTKVKTATLEQLLEKYEIEKIDFLSIDTEGGELDIFKTIDLSKRTISVISIENNYGSKSIQRYMYKNGFELIGKANADEIYIANGEKDWEVHRETKRIKFRNQRIIMKN